MVLFDLIAPLALHYGLRSTGAGAFAALIAAAIAPATTGIVRAIRHRGVDTLAATVLVLLVLSAGAFMLLRRGCPQTHAAGDDPIRRNQRDNDNHDHDGFPSVADRDAMIDAGMREGYLEGMQRLSTVTDQLRKKEDE